MSNQFVINGTTFEDGFNWIALTTPTDSAISEAISGMGHGCYVAMGSREGRDTISGIALGSKEVRKGGSKSYSLAALVYDIFWLDMGVAKFVFVRQIGDDGYYYLSVSGGYIQDGDIIVPSLDKIHDIIREHDGEIYIDSPNAELIADVKEYKDVSVRRLIEENGLNARHLIKTPSDARTRKIKILFGVLVLAGLLYGGYVGIGAIKEWWDERSRQQQVEKSPEQKALEKRARAEQVVGQRLKGHTSGYSPFDLTNGCYGSYLYQGGAFDIGGWKLTEMKCSAGGLETSIEQNNVYELSGESLSQRLSALDGVKVRVTDAKDWLKKATITVNKGFQGAKTLPGLFLEQLPDPSYANMVVKDLLAKLYKTGFGIGNLTQVRMSFPSEQEIPEELLYYEGRFSVQAAGLGQLVKVASLLNHDWIKVTSVRFSEGEKNKSKSPFSYEAEFRYYFK